MHVCSVATLANWNCDVLPDLHIRSRYSLRHSRNICVIMLTRTTVDTFVWCPFKRSRYTNSRHKNRTRRERTSCKTNRKHWLRTRARYLPRHSGANVKRFTHSCWLRTIFATCRNVRVRMPDKLPFTNSCGIHLDTRLFYSRSNNRFRRERMSGETKGSHECKNPS